MSPTTHAYNEGTRLNSGLVSPLLVSSKSPCKTWSKCSTLSDRSLAAKRVCGPGPALAHVGEQVIGPLQGTQGSKVTSCSAASHPDVPQREPSVTWTNS